MKKFILITLLSVLLFACTKEKQALSDYKRPVEMVYELDVAEQDNVSHYIVQVSNDGKVWTDYGKIESEPNITSMEHKYSITLDVTSFYIRDTRFWQRTISYDNDGKFQISHITSIFFE